MPSNGVMMKRKNAMYHFLAPSGHPTDRHQDINTGVIWKGFKETTSVHGIPHIDRAPGTFYATAKGQITLRVAILSAQTLICAAIRACGNMSYVHSVKIFFFKIGAESTPKHAPWKAGLRAGV